MHPWVDRQFDRLCGVLLPPRCLLCGASGQPPCLDLCADCDRMLPRLPATCLSCALPTPTASTTGLVCGGCERAPPPFDRCHAPFEYAFPVDRFVQALKYRGQLAAGRVLGHLLAAGVASLGLHLDVDVIVPVPLHPLRHAARGFNQSAEIARWTARAVGRPCRVRGLIRHRDTPAQVGRHLFDRRSNLDSAFVASASLAGLRIAVVDDVVTTASTVRAAARALRAAGAVSVDIWSVARALSDR